MIWSTVCSCSKLCLPWFDQQFQAAPSCAYIDLISSFQQFQAVLNLIWSAVSSCSKLCLPWLDQQLPAAPSCAYLDLINSFQLLQGFFNFLMLPFHNSLLSVQINVTQKNAKKRQNLHSSMGGNINKEIMQDILAGITNNLNLDLV